MFPRHPEKGFTLLELIVVIVILGVLASISIPTFLAAQERSRTAIATETLQAEDRDARALMALRTGSTVGTPSADEYAVAASEVSAFAPGLQAAQGRKIYLPASSTPSSATTALSNVATYITTHTALLPGELSLDLSGSTAGLATLTSGNTCVLLTRSTTLPTPKITLVKNAPSCTGTLALSQ